MSGVNNLTVEKVRAGNSNIRNPNFIRSNPAISYDVLAEMTQRDRTTVMRNIGKLKDAGILLRVGPQKTGHWEVFE